MSGETRAGGTREPRRLFGIGHHSRGDRRFGFGERVRGEAGARFARQREGREVEAVVAGAFQLCERGAPGLGQAVLADPYRLVVRAGVEGRDRRARGAPVARAERVRLIALSDEALDRRLKRALHRRQRRGRRWVRRPPAAKRLARSPASRGGRGFSRRREVELQRGERDEARRVIVAGARRR